jgi:predicted Zn-ribbon and HTH transcriptional regulator
MKKNERTKMKSIPFSAIWNKVKVNRDLTIDFNYLFAARFISLSPQRDWIESADNKRHNLDWNEEIKRYISSDPRIDVLLEIATINKKQKNSALIGNNLPIRIMACKRCGSTVYRLGDKCKCPECGVEPKTNVIETTMEMKEYNEDWNEGYCDKLWSDLCDITDGIARLDIPAI